MNWKSQPRCRVSVAYAADFYDAATIAWFCGAYVEILRAAVTSPQISLADLFGRLGAPPAGGVDLSAGSLAAARERCAP